MNYLKGHAQHESDEEMKAKSYNGRGVHTPWGNDPFSSCFRILPLFPKKFSDSMENFPNFSFSQEIFRFLSAKISYDVF